MRCDVTASLSFDSMWIEIPASRLNVCRRPQSQHFSTHGCERGATATTRIAGNLPAAVT